ncbi:centromere protein U [Pelobates fuscus]|uniref:centromere protein U n=1 Tax=Pelobates fuscus TaxID=191477 RepID=UPI002FE49454
MEKTQKTPKKAHSPERELAEPPAVETPHRRSGVVKPYALPKDNQNKRMSNRNMASRKVHSPLQKSGPSQITDSPTGNKHKRKPDRNVSPQKRQTPFQKHASPTNESSESEVDQEAHTLHVTPKSKKRRTKSNRSLSPQKLQTPFQKHASPTNESSESEVDQEAHTLHVTPKSKKRRTKSNRSLTPKKAHSPVRELAEPPAVETPHRRSGVVKPYALPKDNQNKRMSNRNMASRKVHSPLQKSGPSQITDSPTGNKHKRKPDRNVSPQKRQTPFQKHASPTNESSESEVDQEAHTLHVTPKSKKRRTKSNRSLGTPRKIQDTSTEKERKKRKTKASSGSGKKKAVSLKPWSSEEVPRSSRDLNELDVVLSECENVFEDFRATIDSDATIKAIDLFFDDFKNQLVKSIEDAQKLKNLKIKNTKMQSEIGMKQKRLISVKYEVIQNESKLKALQKKYSDLQEKHTALKNAKHFLSNLGDLQKRYLKFREKKPNTTETYGISSLPALLLESQTIMNPEKHIRDINSKLENIVGDEKNAL